MNMILSVFLKNSWQFLRHISTLRKWMVCEQWCSVPTHPAHYVGFFSASLHDPESLAPPWMEALFDIAIVLVLILEIKNFEYSLIQNNECHNFYRTKSNLFYDIFIKFKEFSLLLAYFYFYICHFKKNQKWALNFIKYQMIHVKIFLLVLRN